MARPPRISNWLPWEQRSVYFIICCIERRRPVLANPRAWDICLNVLVRLDQWTTLAAITMPDHLHLLMSPLDREASVSAFSKWFKRWFDEEYCRPSVPDGILPVQLGNGRKVVSIACFVPTNLYPTNGNICAKTQSGPVWSEILMIGHTNSRQPARSYEPIVGHLSQTPPSTRRLTETPYNFPNRA